MVRRVRRPGCQHDHMLVLIGEQGIGKSTGLRTLIGDQWFADSMPDLHSKDAKLQLHGKVLIEWSELSALHKSRIETVKNFVTSPIDTPVPYDRAASDATLLQLCRHHEHRRISDCNWRATLLARAMPLRRPPG